MKSILHVITTIERGGAENQLLVLVDQQVKLGYKVLVIYLKGAPELESEFEKTGALVLHEIANIAPVKQILKLNSIIRIHQPIVHAHLPRAEILASMCFAYFPFIVTRHNAEPFFPAGYDWASRLLSRFVAFRADGIIAISSAVAEWLINHKEINSPKKLSIIYYGYSRRLINGDKPRHQVSNTFELGTISRLSEQKDLPTLIRAFSLLLSDIPNVRLSIVGSGPQEESLKYMVTELGLNDRVRFVGRLSNVYDFLQSLDVFVLTSLYEGFGLVLLEAIDAQVPIVASNNSAIPEVLGESFPGLCRTGSVEDFCKTIRALTDNTLKLEFLQLQNRRLEMFDAEEMAVKVIAKYPRF